MSCSRRSSCRQPTTCASTASARTTATLRMQFVDTRTCWRAPLPPFCPSGRWRVERWGLLNFIWAVSWYFIPANWVVHSPSSRQWLSVLCVPVHHLSQHLQLQMNRILVVVADEKSLVLKDHNRPVLHIRTSSIQFYKLQFISCILVQRMKTFKSNTTTPQRVAAAVLLTHLLRIAQFDWKHFLSVLVIARSAVDRQRT